VLSFDEMNEIAAFGGFPTRYPHWRWGMEYERLKKTERVGPVAHLRDGHQQQPLCGLPARRQRLTDQKLVMAHVCAHNDFFKNNFAFKVTDQDRRPPRPRRGPGGVAHGPRARRASGSTPSPTTGRACGGTSSGTGMNAVEEFIDVCHSLENLIDPPARMLEGRPRRGPKDENATPRRCRG
jgi:stage V sporulation protein R